MLKGFSFGALKGRSFLRKPALAKRTRRSVLFPAFCLDLNFLRRRSKQDL